jgi:hypothetical protein
MLAARLRIFGLVLTFVCDGVWVAVRAFDCVELKCTEMSTCAEADYKFKVCHHVKRDADSDGIPCEDLCGKDMTTYRARVKAQGAPDSEAKQLEAEDAGAPNSTLGLIEPLPGPTAGEPAEIFKCAGKRTCAQMLTCAEARFYLSMCRVKSLDRDGDGVPCNSLCR